MYLENGNHYQNSSPLTSTIQTSCVHVANRKKQFPFVILRLISSREPKKTNKQIVRRWSKVWQTKKIPKWKGKIAIWTYQKRSQKSIIHSYIPNCWATQIGPPPHQNWIQGTNLVTIMIGYWPNGSDGTVTLPCPRLSNILNSPTNTHNWKKRRRRYKENEWPPKKWANKCRQMDSHIHHSNPIIMNLFLFFSSPLLLLSSIISIFHIFLTFICLTLTTEKTKQGNNLINFLYKKV